MNSYVFNWRKCCWTSAIGVPVVNADLLQEIDQIRQNGIDVHFIYLKHQKGIHGTEKAHELALEGVSEERQPLDPNYVPPPKRIHRMVGFDFIDPFENEPDENGDYEYGGQDDWSTLAYR